MKFKFVHNNINVLDVEKSIEFYKNALGLMESKRICAPDGSFTIVYLSCEQSSDYELELTQIHGRTQKYDLGENEIHMAYSVDDYDEAYRLHKDMGIICYENKDMGIYFIQDPDGYWTEIIPGK